MTTAPTADDIRRRAATTDDLREATSILDVTPTASIVWSLVSMTDCATERWELIHLSTMLAHTRIEPVDPFGDVVVGL